MAFTYDLSTIIGKVRMIIPDRVTPGHVLEDDEITALYDMENSNLRLAAAGALELMASDQVLTLKVMTLLDVTTDGARVSDALLKRATMLRKKVADLELEAEDALGSFGVAEMVTTDFAARERLYNEALRGS